MSRPTDEQIEDQIDRAMASTSEGKTRWPGMSYEEGVDAALRWATGQSVDPPIEDD